LGSIAYGGIFANLAAGTQQRDGDMEAHSRIRTARRRLKLSQAALASAVGVQRSAVTQWEAPKGKSPTVNNMRRVAEVTCVHFEWLATGRGAMTLTRETLLDSIAAAKALLVEDALETRMVEAMRAVSVQAQILLVEMAEQIASTKKGRSGRPLLIDA
jgi:transcriptional regulator with XRE-family HTH domain